jgi:hypothetical protein
MITGQIISFIPVLLSEEDHLYEAENRTQLPCRGGGGGYLPARPAAAGGGIPLVLVGVAGPGFLNSRPASSAGLSHVDNPDQSIQCMFITDSNFIVRSWVGGWGCF